MQAEAIKQHGKGQGGWLVLLSLKIYTRMFKKNVCSGGCGKTKQKPRNGKDKER